MPPKKRSHEHLKSAAISNAGGGLVTKSCLSLVTAWTVATRLLHPWDSPGKNTGVHCHFHLHSSI